MIKRGWSVAPAMLCPRRSSQEAVTSGCPAAGGGSAGLAGVPAGKCVCSLNVSLVGNSGAVLCQPLFLPVGVTAPCSGPRALPGPLLGESACSTSSIPYLPLSRPGLQWGLRSWPCSVTIGPWCLASLSSHLTCHLLKVSCLPAPPHVFLL